VSVNSVGNLDPAVPVGGWGMSGYGKELGLEQLDEYLETKSDWIAM
jgi:acyl-CoA reductase-like NAD-dependent aldehyde dehydrogenase